MQCEAESLGAVDVIYRKLQQGQVQNAFLQDRMLQSCLTLMLKLFDCPELQSEGSLKVLACLLMLHAS